jgi:phage baseplate assembly protein W
MSFNLGSYIFEPLTQSKAWFIGYEIYQQLPQHEPRVRI